jgi:hypothetical protein
MADKTSENPLIEYMHKRPDELLRNASMEVFDRMRVVELLYLRGDDLKPSDLTSSQKLEDLYRMQAGRLNQLKADEASLHIRESSNFAVRKYLHPYSTSDEVVKDGVDWYLRTKKIVGDDPTMIRRDFENLTDAMYALGYSSGEDLPIVVDPSTNTFSGLVEDIASNKYKSVLDSVTPMSVDAVDELSGSFDASIAEFADESEAAADRFGEAIGSLAGDFDKIYRNQISK